MKLGKYILGVNTKLDNIKISLKKFKISFKMSPQVGIQKKKKILQLNQNDFYKEDKNIDVWRKAMKKEYDTFLKNETWELVDPLL